MWILKKLEEKFYWVDLTKPELEKKFSEENKRFFDTEWVLNTNKNQEIISLWKDIRWKISDLFWDNEELQFVDKISEFKNNVQEKFSEKFNENWEILKENFSDENKAENLELFRESKKIRNEIRWFNETAFLSEEDEEFKSINLIYNKLADFNLAFIEAYSNKKEEGESENKTWNSENPVLWNTWSAEFESWKKSWEVYWKINKIISEKEKFNKVKNREKRIFDETCTFKKLDKSDVEDFWVDIKKQPWAFNIIKNTKSAVWKLGLVWALTLWWIVWNYTLTNNSSNKDTPAKKEKVKKVDNNSSNTQPYIITNESNIANKVDYNETNSSSVISNWTMKHANELAKNSEPKKNNENVEDINISKTYLQEKLTKFFLEWLTNENSYWIEILKKLDVKDLTLKNELTKKDVKNLKELQLSYFKHPETANWADFGKGSLKWLEKYLWYIKSKPSVIKVKKIIHKHNIVKGKEIKAKPEVDKIIPKLSESEKRFNNNFKNYFDENWNLNQNYFDKYYNNFLKGNAQATTAFKSWLNEYENDDEKLKWKVEKILNALNQKTKSEKKETKIHTPKSSINDNSESNESKEVKKLSKNEYAKAYVNYYLKTGEWSDIFNKLPVSEQKKYLEKSKK